MNALTKVSSTADQVNHYDPPVPGTCLTPVQSVAYARLKAAVKAAPFVGLAGACGSGRSTLLRRLVEEQGGEFISIEALSRTVQMRDPMACFSTILMVVEAALQRSDLVVIEDMAALSRYCLEGSAGPMALDILSNMLAGRSKHIVMAAREEDLDWDFRDARDRLYVVAIETFGYEDYATILTHFLPEGAAAAIDMALLWRHAPSLAGHDLRLLARLLNEEGDYSTQATIAILDNHILKSNVRQDQVEDLSFANLPGTEAIAAKLETHIMLPLEQHALARRLDLKPKRGVLLYGPPGTGKTSIGRALAHRMRGKFFLIDGSFTTEPPVAFFGRVTQVVKEAKENAPSVLFVDDADVLFGIEHIAGFSRYLLSLLDGVESETAGKVCLMMTAMNASRIPGSVLRSGRVELWLETALPDVETRAAIIQRWFDADLPSAEIIDFGALAEASSGFTPADLRRIVSDAKSLHAMDIMAKATPKQAQTYLARAITDLIEVRERMADNLRDESLRVQALSAASIYGEKLDGRASKYAAGIGGLASSDEICPMELGNL